jgi:hypothetical protein
MSAAPPPLREVLPPRIRSGCSARCLAMHPLSELAQVAALWSPVVRSLR